MTQKRKINKWPISFESIFNRILCWPMPQICQISFKMALKVSLDWEVKIALVVVTQRHHNIKQKNQPPRLTIKLSHCLTQLHFTKDLFKLWLIHNSHEPSVYVSERSSETWFHHLATQQWFRLLASPVHRTSTSVFFKFLSSRSFLKSRRLWFHLFNIILTREAM